MPPQAEMAAGADFAAALAIEVLDQHSQSRRLADFHGRNLVVYFYPRDDTPGCTVEGKEFRDLHGGFLALECAVVGVSTDSVQSHRAFAEKHRLPFTLLADTGGDLARAFGVLKDGIAQRATFVLDRDGRVARSFYEVSPRGHAQQVLNFVRTMLESHRMLGG